MIVNVNVEEREDGGVRVWSDDLPGLVLSGRDRTKIVANIEPAVRAILEHKSIDPGRNLRIDATVTSQNQSSSK